MEELQEKDFLYEATRSLKSSHPSIILTDILCLHSLQIGGDLPPLTTLLVMHEMLYMGLSHNNQIQTHLVFLSPTNSFSHITPDAYS